jgi:anti-sigma factor RsiW
MIGSNVSGDAGASGFRCAEADDRLPVYLDGEMDDPERRRLEAHLAACARCREELETLRLALGAVRSLPGPEPSSAFWGVFRDEVRVRIAALSPPRPSLRERMAARLGRLSLLKPLPALGLATALGLLLAVGWLRTPGPTPEPPVAEVATVGEASENLGIGMNLEILRDLDLLEALDDLEAVPLPRGEGRPGRLG